MTSRLCVLAAIVPGVSRAAANDQHQVTSIFQPLGTPAWDVYHIANFTFIICAVIFVIVASLLTYALIRFRCRPNDTEEEPPQIYGSNQIETAWTVIPILIVFVLLGVTARIVAEVQEKPAPKTALKATVIGHQWWWEFKYPSLGITTANELNIPAVDGMRSNPTFLDLESADVAHSFWIPQLAGKTDVIPNRRNEMWIDPSKPGTYVGNCTEYCGTQHANMMLRVVVLSKDDFSKWVSAQQQPAVADPQALEARDAFLSLSCVNCHTVRGTPANGKFGPDLTHLMSRQTIASGILPNNRQELREWIKDPQQLKPGNLMPNMQLTDKQIDQVVSYLLTLK